jgi:hypothetical protein
MEDLEIIAHGTRAIFRNGMEDGSRLLATLLMERHSYRAARSDAAVQNLYITFTVGAAIYKKVFPNSQPRWRVSQGTKQVSE